MKETSFEIKIPKFLAAKNIKSWGRLGFSILWLAATFFIGTNYAFSFVEMLILAYFGLSLIWKLDSRIAAGFALLFLISCPILIILKNDALAETFAIYAYYFLVITVVGEVLALKKNKKRGVDNLPGRPKGKIV